MHKYFDIFTQGFLSLFIDEVAQFDAYSLSFSKSDSIYWNGAFKIDMVESEVSEAVVDIELLFFPKKRIPTFWVTKDDRPDDFEFIIRDKGYVQRAIDDWMIHATPTQIQARETNMRIERVESEGQLEDFITVFIGTFSDAEGAYSEILRKKGIDERYKDKSYLFVGYDDDKPIAMSGFVLSGDTAILHSVGVLDKYRKKGRGGVMATHAIANACETGKVKEIMLQVDESNAEAVHLFQTLSFTDLMQVKIYSK